MKMFRKIICVTVFKVLGLNSYVGRFKQCMLSDIFNVYLNIFTYSFKRLDVIENKHNDFKRPLSPLRLFA